MENRYFIVLNCKVVQRCAKFTKAIRLFEEYKKKVNPNYDILQLWEKGNGCINEY